MSFGFAAAGPPFHRWLGPFSPARGTKRGFRFYEGRLGTWIEDRFTLSFWPVVRSASVVALERLVLNNFNGGRILLLPNGTVVKPLQRDSERGTRAYLGEYSGDIVLEKPDGATFSFESPGQLTPGCIWPGPATTGIECTISFNGALACTWYHPTAHGRNLETLTMTGPSAALLAGFQRARLGEQSGRVRVTAKGHVITNRQVRGEWQCFYVGRIDGRTWPYLDQWVV